ncbi:LOW QUALITY PROTEIN: histamine H4 receptor-like [Carcharodon carcharias]|uniref:LOW QUALITY PROTEIN: histamine H4 receptor-like n=1 Tax=Carcharodon carcharias TaxID=13397 RepID=UPI001B7F5281|nr:LOW QUALITY PROTEIN: histamine H4 receptor-like [Carcharodon carcharias]
MLGNALIVLAFVVDKGLRSRTTFFLLNLAISDFLVASIPIFLRVTYTSDYLDIKFVLKRCISRMHV